MAEFETKRIGRLVPSMTGELVRITFPVRVEKKQGRKKRRKGGRGKPVKQRVVVWEQTDPNTVVPTIDGQIAQPEIETDPYQK